MSFISRVPTSFIVAGALLTGMAIAPAAAQAQPSRAPGAFAEYEPAGAKGACAPVAIISRGLGAGQNPMRSLASALAARGYRVIVMRHPQAASAVFQGRLVRSGRLQARTGEEADPAALKARANDLDRAIAHARRVCAPPFMALIGHAIGSTTTLIEAGAKSRISGLAGQNRFDAYVAISPAGPGATFANSAWAEIAKPTLVITGTRDRVGGSGPRARTAAFNTMPAGNKRLAIINGATHVALGGSGSASVRQKVVALTTEFLAQIRDGGLKPASLSGVEIKDK